MSSEAVLSLEDVSKKHTLYRSRTECFLRTLFPFRSKGRDFVALDHLSLEIGKGECVGIMGVNGSGKSTLLQMIAGTLVPSSGKIFARGRIASLLELGGWLDANISGRENIYRAGHIQGWSRGETRRQLDRIADFAEIGDFLDQPVSSYSTGMVMRLAFATSIHMDADILLLDEVFAVGDVYFASKCMDYLRRYIADKTVLLVSHDVNLITSICNRAILLDKGTLVLDGTPPAVVDRYLELCYARKQHVEVNPSEKEDRFVEDCRKGNPCSVAGFEPGRRSFGEGGAEILDVWLEDKHGNRVSCFSGGELVTLSIRARASKDFDLPAVGFFVRSPRGVQIFGDTTFPSAGGKIAQGEDLEARFQFVMPLFPDGSYKISVSVTSGPIENCTIQSWHHEALGFEVRNGLPISNILFSVPQKRISIKVGSKR